MTVKELNRIVAIFSVLPWEMHRLLLPGALL